MLGAVVSTTVRLVVHWAWLPAASATVMVIVVEPVLAVEPAAGDCVIVNEDVQLSLATTVAVKSGTSAVQLAPADSVCAGAQVVMSGAVVSLTVNVAVHVVVLPAASVAVIVIVVEPRFAVEPATGDCVTDGEAVQLSATTTPAVKSGTSAVQFAPAETV
jgi:hypothetical protein